LISLFYFNDLPSDLISFLNSISCPFELINFDSFRVQNFDKVIVLLPRSYSNFVADIILELNSLSSDVILLNPNSVFWLNFINCNNFHGDVINASDFKRLNFFINKDCINLSVCDYSLSYKGKRLNLTKSEFLLLSYLYRYSGKVVTRNEIMKTVWSYSNLSISQTLDSTIYNLRKKISSAFSLNLIHTIYGLGYKFEYDN
jgi:DNA-binding response OmpR family regulator